MRKVREIKIGKAGASYCSEHACDVEVTLVMRDGREVRGVVALRPDVCDGSSWSGWSEPRCWVSDSILREVYDDDDRAALDRFFSELEALASEAAEAWRHAWQVAEERNTSR